jgi:NitT/TauT family transport system ATP-binding protein
VVVTHENRGATAVVASLQDVDVSFTVAGPAGVEQRRALDGVSMEVREGELLVLVGRSGCGKTTVLNLLAGLVASTGGEARVAGRAPAQARDEVAYMFARDALLPWRSARRNVEFALELRERSLGRRERRDRAQGFLDLLGVGRSAHFYPWQLSQGMRQRVALARTWAIGPQIMLMDEPFAALDEITRFKLNDDLVTLWRELGMTVVFVTHSVFESVYLSERIVVMTGRPGRVSSELLIDAPGRDGQFRTSAEYAATCRRASEALAQAMGAPAGAAV